MRRVEDRDQCRASFQHDQVQQFKDAFRFTDFEAARAGRSQQALDERVCQIDTYRQQLYGDAATVRNEPMCLRSIFAAMH